ncbi:MULTISPECIES: TolC family protein [unclassified Spirosoma]|uniref:TolC family protein n=1 Tax=unclassified Spirosoma TaxID=2621999 RepID=UPI0009636F5E|nr:MULTISPECIES: TolC family protein [unclassified Spirosoma]MBN8821477.1 TolC family protein [Spirosoma sp.]OJW78257.1 MAG: hypothetical protein BGO59_30055 [Spirosoma sp. 48-14]
MRLSTLYQLKQPLFSLASTVILGVLVHTAGYGQGNPAATPSGTQPAPTPSAAVTADSLTFDFNQDISVQLIPFEDMFKLALAYSPTIKFEAAVAAGTQASYNLSKVQILQNLTGYANYSSGNQAILSTGTNANDQLAQISNGYRYGVNVAFSIHELFGRPQQIRLAKANYDATIERKRLAEIQLRRDLFNLYQDLLLAQKILQIRLRDDQASLAAYRIAEVELQKGKIAPEAHAFNSNRYAETRATVEQAKTSFIKAIYALELFVGVPIRQLKRV